MRSVTRHAVKEARLKELKQELLNSKKLSEHFDANPRDLEALRHDKPFATARKQARTRARTLDLSPHPLSRIPAAALTLTPILSAQPHLEIVPTYLKPDTEGATAQVSAVAPSRQRLRGLGKKHRKVFGKKRGKSDPLSGRGRGKGGARGRGRGRGRGRA